MVEQDILGFTPNSEPVILYSITNDSGAKVRLMNVGASLVSVEVFDKDSVKKDVVLGYNTFDEYLRDPAALGKTVGRCANRIANGTFTLNDKVYRLVINNGRNHLHGGPTGFQTKVWGSRVEGDAIVFSFQSQNLEENYPGELGVEVTYTWNNNNELLISYMGKPSDDTIVNLTNHTYFNLDGECSGVVNDHLLTLNADQFLPADKNMIPTGEYRNVEGTVMDFRTAKTIGQDIEKEDEQLEIGNGYDHCWAINGWEPGKMLHNAKLYSPKSGIAVNISSTQPGVQIYTGNYLFGTGVGKCGIEHENRMGVAIECQNFPDAINKPNFPTPILRADEIYDEQIQFTFSVE